MVGQRAGYNLTAPKWRYPVEGVSIWHKGHWINFDPSQLVDMALGPEFSFLHRINAYQQGPFGIIKVARTGTYLSTDWRAGHGAMYKHLVAHITNAAKERPIDVKAVLWMQGEADAINLENASNYHRDLKNFVQSLRTDADIPKAAFIAGVVNPPQPSCPHVDIVREALQKGGIPNYQTVSCEGLAKRPDNLHYTVRGISQLGKRFAEAAKMAETAREFRREVVFAGEQHRAIYNGIPVSDGKLVVSLAHATDEDGFAIKGFGEGYFEKRGQAAVYLLSKESDWYQNDEIWKAVDTIRERFGAEVEITSYGASMGAYGALLTSKRLIAKNLMIVAPQFSIDRRAVPFEYRWKKAISRIGEFRYDLADHISPDSNIWVFYDPYHLDRKHIELMPDIGHWHRFPLPYVGHRPLIFLNEIGKIDDVLKGCMNGSDASSMLRAIRDNRKFSQWYWINLGGAASRRHLPAARNACLRAESLGKVNRMLKHLRRISFANVP